MTTKRDELAMMGTRHPEDGSWIINPYVAFQNGFDAGDKHGYDRAIEEVLLLMCECSDETGYIKDCTNLIISKIKRLKGE